MWKSLRRRFNARRQAGHHLAQRDLDRAESLLVKALAQAPDDATGWYDLGLVYKWRRDWEGSEWCNLQAGELAGTPEDPAWWNLGIAATALHDWPIARRAWREYGIPLADGEGELTCDLGITPVRLNVDNGEVVWGERLDPARVRIANVPTPESGYRWGDIVLHDGEPKGQRRRGERTYSVFDVIELWRSSSVPTLGVFIVAPSVSDSKALEDLAHRRGLGAEDWLANMATICRACSYGSVDAQHDHVNYEAWKPERHVGIAAGLEQAKELLEEWAAADGRSYSDLAVEVEPAGPA